MKCLQCDNIVNNISGEKWCSIQCKQQFLIKYYYPESTIRLMKQQQEQFKESQKRVLNEIKESGLTFTEYIKSLGEFK